MRGRGPGAAARLAALAALLAAPEVHGARPPIAIARVQTARPVVALTFDACATARQANAVDWPVVEYLKTEELPATVFLSGRWIDAHPDGARALAALPRVELGSHGYEHRRASGRATPSLGADLDAAQARLAALGRKAVLLRPPFGDFDRRVIEAAASRGLVMVLWDVVSADAGGHVSPARMTAEVVARARAGSIVIFHINGRGRFTKLALPRIVAALRARGFQFTTVSELLALPDARPEAASPALRVPPRPRESRRARRPG